MKFDHRKLFQLEKSRIGDACHGCGDTGGDVKVSIKLGGSKFIEISAASLFGAKKRRDQITSLFEMRVWNESTLPNPRFFDFRLKWQKASIEG